MIMKLSGKRPENRHRVPVAGPATVASVTAEPLHAPRLAQGLPAALIGDVVAGESGHVDVYPARSA
jgi:hypothetical protein